MKNLVVIVIIAHKEHLTKNEKSSLAQCYNILGNHPVVLICPKGLDISEYKKVNDDALFHFIDPKWQANYGMFNRLKKKPFLYNLFKDYEYILFYELDAWVFEDELVSWCSKRLDYIGAPWFKGFNRPDPENLIFGVGNGGFSLRNVSSSLTIAKRLAFLKPLRKFWFKSRLQSLLRFSTILHALKTIFRIDNIDSLNRALTENDLLEDFFWSQVISRAFIDYRVGAVTEAIRFSFEVNPAHLFKLTKNQLPFGCHAWNVHDPAFWKPFIKI